MVKTYQVTVPRHEYDALAARLAEAQANEGAWEATAQHHYKEARAFEKRLAEAERRLAGVIGYCGQEGCDGEPYDTINAIATGEFDPCGSRPTDSADVAPAVPSGDWLWIKLMDWCRKRGVHPGDYNDLFAIVGEARAAQTVDDVHRYENYRKRVRDEAADQQNYTPTTVSVVQK